ncbi:methyltransferase like 21e isoform X6 [Scleropages formosus]|uniref:methyltransferase like 21e isoform X6 n=1 Tax=Scleropages formosus TaxID=113540 RepID=UPI000878DE4C|nr:potassium-transporting ATPase subunit beta isoform X6 [Scleropages formosus]
MEPPEQSVAEEDGLPPALGDKDLADAILHRRFCPSLITTETWEGFEFAGLRIRITESTDCYGAVLWPSSSHRTPLLPISTNSNGAEHLFNDTETTRVTTTHLSPFNILLWSITMATRTISATATVAVAEVRRSVAFGCLAALLAVAALTLCVTLQALVLCHFLDTHREEYSMEDKSIIELGAGTGLVSIVTALLGHFRTPWTRRTDRWTLGPLEAVALRTYRETVAPPKHGNEGRG